MRITSGAFRGRALQVPDGSIVRPTGDKVRQAIFNMLLQYGLPMDAVVIDGFAGSGALGLEALSRGARQAIFFDVHPASLNALKSNIAAFGIADATQVLRRDVTKAGRIGSRDEPAGLIFLDPPYRKDLVLSAIGALMNGGWVRRDALFVIETESEWPCPVQVEDQRVYGDTMVTLALADQVHL